MKPFPSVKTAARTILDPFEELNDEVAKPIFQEALSEFGFSGARAIGRKQSLAEEDLKRAREKQKLEEMASEDQKESKEKIQKIVREYKVHEAKTQKQDQAMMEEVLELKKEVVELAKVSGVKTNVHLENKTKVSKLDIKFLTVIIRSLRFKAEESKSAKELVAERSNAKPPTGMLAWVSGKQMKIHEQGTMQLQG